jgi:hypothetical protein
MERCRERGACINQIARETANEKPYKPLKIAIGGVTNAVKTLPYAFTVLHEIRAVIILSEMMIPL